MTIKRIDLSEPESHHTYSSCVVAGDFVFTSHITGFFDDQGNLVEGVPGQAAQCFQNLSAILAAAGATLADVVKVTVYLKNINDFEAMREVYRGVFSDGYPARMTATSKFFDPRCRLQIDAVAYNPQK